MYIYSGKYIFCNKRKRSKEVRNIKRMIGKLFIYYIRFSSLQDASSKSENFYEQKLNALKDPN